MENTLTRLFIGGDVGITDNDNSIKTVNESLKKKLTNSDFNIFNLECPITTATNEDAILKSGPHIRGNASCNSVLLKDLSTNLVTLANNHILDYGPKGLHDTLDFCKSINIDTVGVGVSRQAAQQQSHRINVKDRKIAFINFAENEWSSATATTAGANPMDIIDNVNQIKKEKETADIVIVLIHGGHEYYNLPSPRMVKQYRFYAENGADLVVGNHAHCVSGYEIYNSVPIYYGLGNLLLSLPSDLDDWYTGLLLEVTIDHSGRLNTTLHPCRQDKNFNLSILEGLEKEKVLERVDEYSRIISEPELLSKQWEDLVSERYYDYLNSWSANSFVKVKMIRSLFYKLKLVPSLTNKFATALHLNLMRSEAHADLSKSVLEKYLKR
ncbi:MAG: CapA family protein [Flavobacterium sp.]|nr:MAG: CapA family protein [Flavobacterium sp.]